MANRVHTKVLGPIFRSFSTIIRHFNEEWPWTPIQRRWNFVFWVLPKVGGRLVPLLHFKNTSKHEQNHDLVTNIILWPPIVPLHCTLISKFDTTCTSTIRSFRTRIRSKRCPLEIIVINKPSIKLVERRLSIHVLIILDFEVIFEFQFPKVPKIEKKYEKINSEFASFSFFI